MYLKYLILNSDKYDTVKQFAEVNNISINTLTEYISRGRSIYSLKLELLVSITKALDIDLNTFLEGLEEFNKSQKVS